MNSILRSRRCSTPPPLSGTSVASNSLQGLTIANHAVPTVIFAATFPRTLRDRSLQAIWSRMFSGSACHATGMEYRHTPHQPACHLRRWTLSLARVIGVPAATRTRRRSLRCVPHLAARLSNMVCFTLSKQMASLASESRHHCMVPLSLTTCDAPRERLICSPSAWLAIVARWSTPASNLPAKTDGAQAITTSSLCHPGPNTGPWRRVTRRHAHADFTVGPLCEPIGR